MDQKGPRYLILAVCTVALLLTLHSPAQAGNGSPRVLLLGDSICSGYEKLVKKAFEGNAIVERNGITHSKMALERVDKYLGDKRWDIIHFNCGLWDMRHKVKDGEMTYAVPIEQYEENLVKLVKKFKKTGAKVIWANTTPVLWDKPGKGRTDPDVIRYNKVACKVMKENGVLVNDLYTVIKPRIDELQTKAYSSDVHYNEKGNKVLCEAVVKSIQAALEGATADQEPAPKPEKAKKGDL